MGTGELAALQSPGEIAQWVLGFPIFAPAPAEGDNAPAEQDRNLFALTHAARGASITLVEKIAALSDAEKRTAAGGRGRRRAPAGCGRRRRPSGEVTNGAGLRRRTA